MSGSNKGEDMRQDDAAYESKDVESKISEHLAKLTERESPTPDEPEPEVEDQSTPEETASADDTPQETDNEPEADNTIPDNIYRAVIHSGWTPEEIAEFHQANPTQALKVFTKLYQDVNNLSRQFAEIGRTRIQMEREQPHEEKPLVDIEAIRKEDPDNPLLPALEAITKELTAQRAAPQPQQARTQEDIALATQVLTFLGGDPMKVYADFYGPAYDEARIPTFDGHGLTPGQRANRDALLQYADEIWVGARQHGRNMTVPEALGLAHSLLTESLRTAKVREELVGKIKQRAKGMTLRTSKSKPVTGKEGDKPKTPQELEARIEARLAALRNKHR